MAGVVEAFVVGELEFGAAPGRAKCLRFCIFFLVKIKNVGTKGPRFTFIPFNDDEGIGVPNKINHSST